MVHDVDSIVDHSGLDNAAIKIVSGFAIYCDGFNAKIVIVRPVVRPGRTPWHNTKLLALLEWEKVTSKQGKKVKRLNVC